MSSAYEAFSRLYSDYNALEAAIGLMNWDRQVLMPTQGAAARTAHVSLLTQKAHQLLTGDEMLRALEHLEADVEEGSEQSLQAGALRKKIDIERKLPADLIERKSRVSSNAYEAWKRAKSENDFKILRDDYSRLFDIARETSELLGWKDHVYDPLISLYEEGATYRDAKQMFEEIKDPIRILVQEIRSNGRVVDDALLVGDWNQEELRTFAQSALATIGFDFNSGRLNIAPNAFCMNLSCGDVRMTTRPSSHIKGILSSSLHEMGHALYEQNSPRKWDRTPLAGGVSLGVHESQSRLWENIVGRSAGFWSFFFPKLSEHFPSLSPMPSNEFYRAYNKVSPEFIRVGADELTYNLHILVRFELEVEILTGQLKIDDLPEAWNSKYNEYLGITPPSDTVGCLQDVHWSRGYVGYFPTYSMGNLIGGQIWARLREDVDDVQGLMESGNFEPILAWLTDNVYRRAKSMHPAALVKEITGQPMGATEWLKYATAKFRDIYLLD